MNKRKKLLDISYSIPLCCGLCSNGIFVKGNDFGTCSIYQYEHLKHTGKPRQLSVHKFGSCLKAHPDKERIHSLLGKFEEFIS